MIEYAPTTQGKRQRLLARRAARLAARKARPQFSDVVFLILSVLVIFGIANGFYVRLKPVPVQAEPPVLSLPKEATEKTPTFFVRAAGESDQRLEKVTSFLESKNSPLAAFAPVLIDQADEHAIDWTLMIAISGMESNYGKTAPEDSHNPFGIGGSNLMYFSTWESAIEYEAALLGNHYRLSANRGIGQKYCPTTECNAAWASTVTAMSQSLLEYE